jgi:DNA-binding MarR family transcriptional regulator
LTTVGNDLDRVDKICQQFVNLIEKALIAEALGGAADGEELSRAQYDGLRYVHLHPDCCIKDLAQGLAVSHPAAVKLVERLAGRALIAREVRDEDRRVVRLRSTPEGARIVAAVRGRRAVAFEQIAGAMEAGQVDALAHCIDDFIRSALHTGVVGRKVCLQCGVEHRDKCTVFSETEGLAA